MNSFSRTCMSRVSRCETNHAIANHCFIAPTRTQRQTKPSDFDKKKLDEDWLQRQKYSRLASKCQNV